MKPNLYQKYLIAVFAIVVVYWVALFVFGSKDGFYNYLFSFLFGLIPLMGGVLGLRGSKMWGWLQSTIGRAIFFLSLGLILWGCGEAVWSYYNFFVGEAAPYPSWADLGFGPSIFC